MHLPLVLLLALSLISIVLFKTQIHSNQPTLPILKQQIRSDIMIYQDPKQEFQVQYQSSKVNPNQDSEEEYSKRSLGDARKNFSGYVQYEPPKVISALSFVKEADGEKKFDKAPLTIWVFDNPNNLNIDSWYSRYWYYPFLWGVFSDPNKSQIKPDVVASISGQVAYSKEVTYQDSSPKYLYLSRPGKMFLFRVIDLPETKLGTQLLSNFKFTQ